MNYHISFDLPLKQNNASGKYYAVEGIDGAGKTTQVKLLAEYFRQQGKEVLETKEPGEGVIADLIAKVLRRELTIPPISLQYLFCADRAIHLKEVVEPALKAGIIVISDRSLWSAVAYGIVDQKLPENEKQRIIVAYNAVLALYGGYLIPDKTFMLKVPFEVAVERTKKRNEALSIYDESEKLKKIEKEYEFLANKFNEVISVVDGNGHKTPEEVNNEIISKL